MPAPRLSATPGAIQKPPAHPGQHTEEILLELGYNWEDISELRETSAI